MTAAFLGLEAALYAIFMTLDLTGGSGDPVKYASIAVCLVFSGLFARRGGSRLMAAAMALTLGADTFLLLLNRWYGAGVALFCGVQGLYLIRILRRCGRSLWGLRLFLVTAAWVGLWALGLLSPLNLLAAVYFANFLVNACQALSLSMPLFAWSGDFFRWVIHCASVADMPVHPCDEIRLGHQLPRTELKRGEILKVHQGVYAGFGNGKCLCQRLGIQHIGQIRKNRAHCSVLLEFEQ